MKIQIGVCNAANFRKGRPLDFRPEAIVLHTSMTSMNGLRLQLSDPNSSTSAHYAVDANGDVTQFVDETDTAFHAGVVERPDWRLLRDGTNPNFYTIGISFTGSAAQDFTEEQYRAGAELIAAVAERWGIALDPDHVITHRRIRASRNCPGEKVDIARLITGAANEAPPQSAVALNVHLTLRSNANLRSGMPSTSAPQAGKLQAGSKFEAAGFVSGERVSGNSTWYTDGHGLFLWAGATDTPDPSATAAATTDEQQLSGPPPPPPAGPVVIDRKTFALPRGQYVDEITKKDLIILHFTAGPSARSAFNSWTSNPERVATAYIIDPDGKIYETFDPARWAFHLGLETNRHDKRSIGIEIANVGPLSPAPGDPKTLNWWPPKKHCGIADSASYVKASYRSHDFYAAFPAVQVESVVALVHHLCDTFGIKKELAPPEKRDQWDRAFFDKFTGIATHANFRKDKFDIGPAFDWRSLGI